MALKPVYLRYEILGGGSQDQSEGSWTWTWTWIWTLDLSLKTGPWIPVYLARLGSTGIPPSRLPTQLHHPGYTHSPTGTVMTEHAARQPWSIKPWGSNPSLNSPEGQISGCLQV